MNHYSENFTPRQIRTIRLNKLQVALTRHLATELLEPRVDFDERWIADDIVISVRGYIWADENEYHKTISYPADWWQAFKLRWFPAWLLQLFPARKITHEISAKTIYPELKVSAPHMAHHLMIQSFDAEATDEVVLEEEPPTWIQRLEKAQGWS